MAVLHFRISNFNPRFQDSSRPMTGSVLLRGAGDAEGWEHQTGLWRFGHDGELVLLEEVVEVGEVLFILVVEFGEVFLTLVVEFGEELALEVVDLLGGSGGGAEG